MYYQTFTKDYRQKCIRFFLTLSDTWRRPDYVTYHAIEILDNFVAASDKPKDARTFFNLSCVGCFLLSCKMDGLYPPYKEVSNICLVAIPDLYEHERLILSTLDWQIKPCYTFMDIHIELPERLLPLYNKIISRSYELNQLHIYPKEVIKAAILSILYDENDYNVVVTSDVDPKDQSLCKLALQVCKDTLCSTPNSPISVCDKHVTSTSKL